MSNGLQTVLTWAMGQSPLQMCGPSGSGTNDACVTVSLEGGHECASSSCSVTPDSLSRLWDAEASIRPSGSYLSPGEIERIFGDEMCPICWEPLQGRAQTITLCGHVFHRACLNKYGGSTCPKCRKPIDELESDPQQMPTSPSPAVSSSLQASGVRQSRLAVGEFVVIHGLHNHTELNGTHCCIVQCQEQAERYEVRSMTSGQLYRVKAANLATMNEHATTSRRPSGDQAQTDVSLSVESLELVPAESSTPSSPSDHGTTPVQHSHDILEIGTVVRLMYLRTAVRFNGLRAEITGVMDRERGTYEIQLQDGRVKTIARANMEIICLAEASSVPREHTPVVEQL